MHKFHESTRLATHSVAETANTWHFQGVRLPISGNNRYWMRSSARREQAGANEDLAADPEVIQQARALTSC